MDNFPLVCSCPFNEIILEEQRACRQRKILEDLLKDGAKIYKHRGVPFEYKTHLEIYFFNLLAWLFYESMRK
jgi:hypothetical protein